MELQDKDKDDKPLDLSQPRQDMNDSKDDVDEEIPDCKDSQEYLHLTDSQLIAISTKDLNKMIKENEVGREEQRNLKQKRRILKNRGYNNEDNYETILYKTNLTYEELAKITKKDLIQLLTEKGLLHKKKMMLKKRRILRNNHGLWYENRRTQCSNTAADISPSCCNDMEDMDGKNEDGRKDGENEDGQMDRGNEDVLYPDTVVMALLHFY